MAINFAELKINVNNEIFADAKDKLHQYGVINPDDFNAQDWKMSWLIYSIKTNKNGLVRAIEEIPFLVEQLLFKFIDLNSAEILQNKARIEQMVDRITKHHAQPGDTIFVVRALTEKYNAHLDLLMSLSPEKQDEIEYWSGKARQISLEKQAREAQEKLAEASGLV